MSYNLIPKQDVEKAKFNELIVHETAQQVIKDFAGFGMEVTFPDNLHYAYDDLLQQLTLLVGDLLHNEEEKLSALLYQIDLDESKFKEESDRSLHEHEWLSEMILHREFLKVLTRHYFKDHPEKL
ncbi:MAG TPA: hypothetical protein VE870_14530 [Bacteroidales bacterium]|nr:hypothetical protein [Bacteroidales bacterium]